MAATPGFNILAVVRLDTTTLHTIDCDLTLSCNPSPMREVQDEDIKSGLANPFLGSGRHYLAVSSYDLSIVLMR